MDGSLVSPGGRSWFVFLPGPTGVREVHPAFIAHQGQASSQMCRLVQGDTHQHMLVPSVPSPQSPPDNATAHRSQFRAVPSSPRGARQAQLHWGSQRMLRKQSRTRGYAHIHPRWLSLQECLSEGGLAPQGATTSHLPHLPMLSGLVCAQAARGRGGAAADRGGTEWG